MLEPQSKMTVPQSTLDHVRNTEDSVIVCINSRSALAALVGSPTPQHTSQRAAAWRQPLELIAVRLPVRLHWVPPSRRSDGLQSGCAPGQKTEPEADRNYLELPALPLGGTGS